ncbi:GlxA family transcriptional regulator [Mesorhizobium sp. GR13]|uniref:GlxA family transcriptional regulator n=1 Tax=Mesorhizobium sp. GR13 TaxID=2562308 RepID=UPI001FEE96A0|nr:GlxA family transcriptional regulator [Mesorhizobium sp. GR13]
MLAREFTLSPLSLFIDTLRLAGDDGDRSRRVAFDWQIVGERGLPLRSSCGIEILPTCDVGNPESYDHIVVVGGLLKATHELSREKEEFLLAAARLKKPLVGLCTASFALARYGLLDNHSACVSWFHIRDFRASFPNVDARADSLYLIDRSRATCAGGTGAADLAGQLVKKYLNDVSAQKAANVLMLDRIRSVRDPQPISDMFPGATSSLVKRALLLMESNLHESLSIAEIASQLQISNRQLERRFALELGMGPADAYGAVRINFARKLLADESLQIAEVAFRSGFISASHFSRVFRQHTGVSPSELRTRMRPDRDANPTKASL